MANGGEEPSAFQIPGASRHFSFIASS